MSDMGWLEIALAALLLLALLARAAIRMPGRSHRGPLPALDAAETAVSTRLRAHVRALADEIGERHVWHRGSLEAAAGYVEGAFRGAGLAVDAQHFAVRGVTVRNVIGAIGPDDASADCVVIGAHYDSVVGTAGANDNASGVAALVEVARALATRSLQRPVRAVAFVNEEPPFFLTADMGSRRYARMLAQRGVQVHAMLSLETLGCYTDRPLSQSYPIPLGLLYPRTGNFVAFVGNLRSRGLVRRCVRSFRSHTRFPCEGAALPGYVPGVFWSDHWAFWREGYPAAMVTDTALFRYGYYHLPGDTSEKLDYGRLARVATR
jgi:hypothetical protein